jgi:trk system potassium uptake protein
MLFRPDSTDFRLIGFYTGKVIFGVGAAMVVPLIAAIVADEPNEAYAFLIAMSLGIILGRLADWKLATAAQMTTSHGLATVALSWLLAPFLAAIPLLLSGHYLGFLDAYFEAMSGFATIGLSTVNDLDHMARSVNLWRHLMQFLGGQGIVVVVLTIFASAGGRVGALYTGEGRAEKVVPNVIRTARFIWRVALIYGLIGTTAIWLALVTAGLPPLTALYHAANLFMTAFDTAGFTTQSANVAFYRSTVVEFVLLPMMAAGAFSFALHYALWQGRPRELFRNFETRTMAVTILGLFSIAAIGLARSGAFTDFFPLFRHNFFHIISAHTTTGLSTVPGRLFVTDWGVLAPAMIVAAMAIGGMAGSTAGGIKVIRVGIILKSLRQDIRKVLYPEDAVVVESVHATRGQFLDERRVRAAATILLLWLALYLGGALMGLFYGYDLQGALFESTAASSSGGLSIGIVRPDLEAPMKVLYITQMIVGRLEFIAPFALVGYVVAIFKGQA